MSEGRKDDAGKLPWGLIPFDAVGCIGKVLQFGAKKYAPRNWEKGMDWERPFAACIRHLTSWWHREPSDPETGFSHLWHAGCCIMFLIAYELRAVGGDNRPLLAGKLEQPSIEPVPDMIRYDGCGYNYGPSCVGPIIACSTCGALWGDDAPRPVKCLFRIAPVVREPDTFTHASDCSYYTGRGGGCICYREPDVVSTVTINCDVRKLGHGLNGLGLQPASFKA